MTYLEEYEEEDQKRIKEERNKRIELQRPSCSLHERTEHYQKKQKKKFYTKVYLCISKMPKTFNIISIILYRDLGCSV